MGVPGREGRTRLEMQLVCIYVCHFGERHFRNYFAARNHPTTYHTIRSEGSWVWQPFSHVSFRFALPWRLAIESCWPGPAANGGGPSIGCKYSPHPLRGESVGTEVKDFVQIFAIYFRETGRCWRIVLLPGMVAGVGAKSLP